MSDSTLQAHRYRLNHFIRWCDEVDGIDDMNELSGRDIHRYKLWRQEDGDLNKVSLKSQMDTLRVFIRFCETIDAVEPDLHDKILSPTLSDGIGQRDVKLEADEAKELLNHLERFEYASFSHILILLLWSTGIRIGSLRALDLEDVDETNERVTVQHRPETDTPLKNNNSGERLIALKPTTCTVLANYIEVNRQSVSDDHGREPLLTTKNGRPSTNTIRSTVYRWTRPCQYRNECPHDRDMDECEALNKRMGASKCPSSVSPHAIRRGSITHYLTEDVPERIVSDRMNVSQRVLEKHYDRRSEEVKVEQRRGYLNNI